MKAPFTRLNRGKEAFAYPHTCGTFCFWRSGLPPRQARPPVRRAAGGELSAAQDRRRPGLPRYIKIGGHWSDFRPRGAITQSDWDTALRAGEPVRQGRHRVGPDAHDDFEGVPLGESVPEEGPQGLVIDAAGGLEHRKGELPDGFQA